MKNQEHNQNKEMPMEKLFQEAYSGHSEPTNEQDFDQFLSKLEDTGYFNEGRNWARPAYLLSGLAVIAGLIALYFFLVNTSDEKNISNKNSTEINTSETIVDENSGIDSSVSTKGGIVNAKSVRNHKVNRGTLIAPASVAITSEQKVIVEEVPVASAAKDSIVNGSLSDKKKISKDSVRIRYVMAVDTVKFVDSLNIKKRKYQKMKEKSK